MTTIKLYYIVTGTGSIREPVIDIKRSITSIHEYIKLASKTIM